jgi:endonuclease/exonuclease/phosphatase family metal-dependent hydrolase
MDEFHAESMSPVTLTLGTFNIYNTTARYPERKAILSEAISMLLGRCHVLGVQEVGGGNQLETLGVQVIDADFAEILHAPLEQPIVAPSDPSFLIAGNAILISHLTYGRGFLWTAKPDSHRTLALSPQRVVQTTRIIHLATGIEIVVANCHLHWASDPLGISTREDAALRGEQLKRSLEWVEHGVSKDTTIVFLGDFNSFFDDEEIFSLFSERGYFSCHKAMHGHEAVTVPTPLEAPTILPESVVEQQADLVMVRGGIRDGDTETRVRVLSCYLTNKVSATDKTLCASDHFSVTAEIEVRPEGVGPGTQAEIDYIKMMREQARGAG